MPERPDYQLFLTSPGMEFFMDFPKPVAGDMGVDFRGTNIGMAEQFLDDTQVGAMFQEMCRKAVPQHVRSDVALDAGPANVVFNPQPECDGRKRSSAPGQKNIRGGFWRDEFWACYFDVAIQRFNGFFSHRHDALFVAFADDVDEPGFQVQLLQPEIF